MMTTISKKASLVWALTLLSLSSAPALSAGMPRIANPFNPENAIIDTNIPFAIGARQAEQALRGSFGWATFQEGFVNGIYFRFDPDGYARFSRSPRLEHDVFEVICPTRQYFCEAQKDGMSVKLFSNDYLKVNVEGVQSGDRFFLYDGISELEVPERIFEPLDPQTENLLASGGNLLIRRNSDTLYEISLSGLDVVAAYLRWVAARQNYGSLPRDWPVPVVQKPLPQNTFYQNAGLKRPGRWQIPVTSGQHPPADSILSTNLTPGLTPALNPRAFSNLTPSLAPSLPPNQYPHATLDAQKPQSTPYFEALLQEIDKLRSEFIHERHTQPTHAQPRQYATPEKALNARITAPQEWREAPTQPPQSQPNGGDNTLIARHISDQILRLEFDIERLHKKLEAPKQTQEITPEEDALEENAPEVEMVEVVEETIEEDPAPKSRFSLTPGDMQLIALLINQARLQSSADPKPAPALNNVIKTKPQKAPAPKVAKIIKHKPKPSTQKKVQKTVKKAVQKTVQKKAKPIKHTPKPSAQKKAPKQVVRHNGGASQTTITQRQTQTTQSQQSNSNLQAVNMTRTDSASNVAPENENFTDLLIFALLEEIIREGSAPEILPQNYLSSAELGLIQEQDIDRQALSQTARLLQMPEQHTGALITPMELLESAHEGRQRITEYIPLDEYISAVFDER